MNIVTITDRAVDTEDLLGFMESIIVVDFLL